MTKIDLDELERKALGAAQSTWRPGSDPYDDYVLDLDWHRVAVVEGQPGSGRANARHIAANSPPVTLALIARIRELESELTLACDRIDAFHESYTKVGRDPLGLVVRGILEKGAVLP